MDIDHKRVAELFDKIAEAYIALGGAFRGAGEGGGAAADDAPAPAKSRKRKPAAAEPEKVTAAQVRAALQELSATKGKTKMVEVLAEFDAAKLADVEEDQYAAVLAAAKAAMEAEDEDEDPPPAKKGKKGKALTSEEVTEQFQKLVDADKAAAKKVLKAHGLARLSDLDMDDTDAVKSFHEAVAVALEEDDDEALM